MSETDGFKYQFEQLSFSFRLKGNFAVYIHVYSIWLNLKTVTILAVGPIVIAAPTATLP